MLDCDANAPLLGQNGVEMSTIEPKMPVVEEKADLDRVFAVARRIARSPVSSLGQRQLVIVTPGRLLRSCACRSGNLISKEERASFEKLIRPVPRRNIAVIAYAPLFGEPPAEGKVNPYDTVPFYGLLLGLTSIGHAVWIFEGDRGALRVGCREADLLIVDGGMVPFLADDWVWEVRSERPQLDIRIHDRVRYTLVGVP